MYIKLAIITLLASDNATVINQLITTKQNIEAEGDISKICWLELYVIRAVKGWIFEMYTRTGQRLIVSN